MFGFDSGVLHVLLLCLAVVTAGKAVLKDEYLVDPKALPGFNKLGIDAQKFPLMYAGHIDVFEQLKKESDMIPEDYGYFFWKFEDPENIEKGKPLIFWLNGGPGCSSMDGALVENGPLRVDSKGNVYLNKGSWHSRGDLVFTDQPIGTGFSSLNDTNMDAQFFEDSLDGVSERFMEFLINYMKVFPEDADREIILAGESYAGQYIPFFANRILEYNKQGDIQPINLMTLLIGNGWIDPTTQSLSYLPFALDNKVIDKNDGPVFEILLRTHELCQNQINSAEYAGSFEFPECERLFNRLTEATRAPIKGNQLSCVNVYNYELDDTYPSCGMNWPADIPFIKKFLNQDSVKQALHLDNKPWITDWRECNSKVGKELTNKELKPSIELLPSLLESGVDIILFNGDKDIICNHIGVMDSINNMHWGGTKGFSSDAEEYDWYYRNPVLNDDEMVGYVKYDRNLTFINVFNASHMVPYDKGEASRGLLDISMNQILLGELGKRTALVSGDEPFIFDDEEGTDEEENEEEFDSDDEGDDTDESDDEGDDTDESDDEGEDVSDEDDDDEDKEEEEEEDDEEENEEDQEDEENVNYGEEKAEDAINRKGLVVAAIFATFIAVLLLIKFRNILKPKIISLMNTRPYSRLNGHKTVTWADDLEIGEMDFEINDEEGNTAAESSKTGTSNLKKAYQPESKDATAKGTGDDSIELQDL
ncbi:serine-type carboxypeptidase KNAG_0B00650 [Huiozyma naganishii CBS 8797]|uniref:Carboxypeptidase n=1 Tax=Huiozyma naganishii (strain ATCC MYA-139 / BCRC 22969 / CBS 8797 / KCTC 17520 / NBRC 10181 / NCYC 3082 / Yp74L-3) TaxID=1071383 RepID=J7RG53_HUIN7|nr:hypothetical protein KNAG_0B00650 [Kazachstania naganishii CBS 8797]CCK68513.1 hypothetical protein KNAG_0B00650 [Kazachstania naganishii CBS 8797]